MAMNWRQTTWKVIVGSVKGFSDDKITTHAAALAFCTMLSIAPLLIVAIAIAGVFVGERTAQSEIFHRLQDIIGADAARMVHQVLTNARVSRHGTLAMAMSLATMLFGATAVFSQLQDTLNLVWKVTGKPGVGIVTRFFRKRVLTFLALLALGMVLLASLVLSATLSTLRHYVGLDLQGALSVWQAVDVVVSVVVTGLLFGAVYRILPDVRLAWRHVWLGSLVTAVLFAMGKIGIGLYIIHSGMASAYGAAGALVVLLLWVYYSTIIFLLGAEFVHAYALQRGEEIPPAKYAVKMSLSQPVLPEQSNGNHAHSCGRE
jgi:membrane protein